MRVSKVVCCCACLAACTPSTNGEWHRASSTEQSQLERAKAICNGRASQTQVSAGRLWIAGAVASDNVFKACMAELGYVQ
ncbi:hypothetical protein CO670_25500 [Rhizobium sp. J15]|nr:hypothetical protein CO670_25500 [Rhizobium sp. J15]